MSVDQARRNLNRLDKELADLEKKLADEAKKEAQKTKRINDIQRSIIRDTSMTMKQSKMRQIQGYQDDLVRITNNKASINKKIADKRRRRSEAVQKLQKEELAESKKQEASQKKIYTNYERRIADLQSQLAQNVMTQAAPNYIYSKSNNEEYDVFISHASEDKESFADELCHELKKAGIKVWYDALNISWGDSLRAEIDNGLKKSRYGIVILSNDYLKKGWTQYELDGLFQREMTDGKIILPIWHNITKKEVQDFSPTLSGRRALTTSIMTPKEISDELRKILGF